MKTFGKCSRGAAVHQPPLFPKQNHQIEKWLKMPPPQREKTRWQSQCFFLQFFPVVGPYSHLNIEGATPVPGPHRLPHKNRLLWRQVLLCFIEETKQLYKKDQAAYRLFLTFQGCIFCLKKWRKWKGQPTFGRSSKFQLNVSTKDFNESALCTLSNGRWMASQSLELASLQRKVSLPPSKG